MCYVLKLWTQTDVSKSGRILKILIFFSISFSKRIWKCQSWFKFLTFEIHLMAESHPTSYKYLISLFFCRFFEIFSKQPTKWYKCKTLVSWISDLYHSLTSKAAKMSINTAISEKVIKLYKGHLFAIKISFLSFKRVVNSYFIKEIHIEQILTAKDWYFNLR